MNSNCFSLSWNIKSSVKRLPSSCFLSFSEFCSQFMWILRYRFLIQHDLTLSYQTLFAQITDVHYSLDTMKRVPLVLVGRATGRMINQVQAQPTLDTRLPTQQPLTNRNLWFLNDEFICLPVDVRHLLCNVCRPSSWAKRSTASRCNMAETAIKNILKIIRINVKHSIAACKSRRTR